MTEAHPFSTIPDPPSAEEIAAREAAEAMDREAAERTAKERADKAFWWLVKVIAVLFVGAVSFSVTAIWTSPVDVWAKFAMTTADALVVAVVLWGAGEVLLP